MTLKYDEQGHPYEDLTTENKKLKNRVKELDNSLTIALELNDKYQRESVSLEKQKEILKAACKKAGETIKALTKRAQEAEGEVTIVKGIGQNSPEMKTLQKEVEELKANLARAKEDHQYDNLVHQKELESLGKK